MIELNFEVEQKKLGASLKVIGIGGGGCNAVNSMIQQGSLEGVDFIIANTDAQALEFSPASSKIQLGAKITKGLGAGSNPEVGKRAAEEDLDTVLEYISDSDILFLTAGLGGGTGSGALPVIARAAREAGILSVAIVTKPFSFEGKRRLRQADEAIASLRGVVDTLVIVPNQKLLDVVDPKISMLGAFEMSNDILMQAIKGIADIITKPGYINVDFADVRAVMKDMGMAIMGTGCCSGENRAKRAVEQAVSSPLLENVSIRGARGVLINISGNNDLGLHEIHEAASLIYEAVSPEANIILGSVIDPNMGDDIMVTVIATGFEDQPQQAMGTEKVVAALKCEKIEHAVSPAVILEEEQHKEFEAAASQEKPVLQVSDEVTIEKAMGAQVEDVKTFTATDAAQGYDLDDVDTPAFLRKKAHADREGRAGL